eukprot:CAMPEP_0170284688 /NCGR_PEP_ID=MMETSP0116_2-20130129/42383_1 /TAXON_ID=400756 /ORGANISM="Durinskia baltica, Strain CSIRO CS-38" /LENGTH=157 /DNA_ID=CAMNT_0010536069 /DNA_START=172 /DNA_END=645 /DNA_ORIENTATION=-
MVPFGDLWVHVLDGMAFLVELAIIVRPIRLQPSPVSDDPAFAGVQQDAIALGVHKHGPSISLGLVLVVDAGALMFVFAILLELEVVPVAIWLDTLDRRRWGFGVGLLWAQNGALNGALVDLDEGDRRAHVAWMQKLWGALRRKRPNWPAAEARSPQG